MVENDACFNLIVALGNPGKEYEGTRHNAGFIVADKFVKTLDHMSEFRVAGGAAGKFAFNSTDVYIFKPLKFMNVSGESVAIFLAKKEINPEKMFVIYDDMDIPLGKIRISVGGSSSGHKGVESIIANLAFANFARLRVGIGRHTRFDPRQYVLSTFQKDEKKIFEKAVELSVSAVKFLLENGVRKAMNEFNGQNIASLNEIANTKT